VSSVKTTLVLFFFLVGAVLYAARKTAISNASTTQVQFAGDLDFNSVYNSQQKGFVSRLVSEVLGDSLAAGLLLPPHLKIQVSNLRRPSAQFRKLYLPFTERFESNLGASAFAAFTEWEGHGWDVPIDQDPSSVIHELGHVLFNELLYAIDPPFRQRTNFGIRFPTSESICAHLLSAGTLGDPGIREAWQNKIDRYDLHFQALRPYTEVAADLLTRTWFDSDDKILQGLRYPGEEREEDLFRLFVDRTNGASNPNSFYSMLFPTRLAIGKQLLAKKLTRVERLKVWDRVSRILLSDIQNMYVNFNHLPRLNPKKANKRLIRAVYRLKSK
jgi:hypothetical protein